MFTFTFAIGLCYRPPSIWLSSVVCLSVCRL